MDHDIAYILLRDANPDYIQALMHPNAFTIPANVLHGETMRPSSPGRYSALPQQAICHCAIPPGSAT